MLQTEEFGVPIWLHEINPPGTERTILNLLPEGMIFSKCITLWQAIIIYWYQFILIIN
ncbi:hypothetical protein P865_01705 [Brucella abortus 82]|nr:hypothetical protein M798_03630 [Brucella melitensis ADMAS-G1]ERM04905.1 hypothetical protein P408_10190 [Brucella abortus S99]ERM87676.1 hypothetical protein P865_01705 [Brucella abortus 82]EXU84997.1 hypothetical protein AX23_00130 [Brucella melitensis 548]